MQATGRPRRREELGAESRRRLLDAAEELFASRGVDGTSFVMIESVSGISRGSILWHFGSKEGLLVAVLDRVIDRFAPGPLTPGEDGLEALLQILKAWFQNRSADFLLAVLPQAADPESPIHDSYLALQRRLRALLCDWLAASPDYRLPGVPVADQAVMLMALGSGTRAQAMVDPGAVHLDAVAAAARDWVRIVAAAKPAAGR